MSGPLVAAVLALGILVGALAGDSRHEGEMAALRLDLAMVRADAGHHAASEEACQQERRAGVEAAVLVIGQECAARVGQLAARESGCESFVRLAVGPRVRR